MLVVGGAYQAQFTPSHVLLLPISLDELEGRFRRPTGLRPPVLVDAVAPETPAPAPDAGYLLVYPENREIS